MVTPSKKVMAKRLEIFLKIEIEAFLRVV